MDGEFTVPVRGSLPPDFGNARDSPPDVVGCPIVSISADTEAAVPVPVRRGLGTWVRDDAALIISGVVWVVLVVNFSVLSLRGSDSQVQYGFVKRLFGDAHSASGYYFGLGLVEAPLYALGKLLHGVGLQSVAGNPVEQATIALGLGLLTVSAWPLLSPVFRGLSLRHGALAVLAAGLGTPIFYYVTILPGKNHALDALLFTGVVYLVFRYFNGQPRSRWLPFAIGALFGFAYTVRYFSGAEAVMLVLLLAYWRRWRDAIAIAATSAVVCLALFAIPHAFGVPVFSGGLYSPENVLTFAPLNPLRMLFSDHRGYFVWSPVAFLALLGYVALMRRRPEQRRFLVAVAAMGVAVIASYALISFWDGGQWAFGQRFYSTLFPVVAIGLAGLLDIAPRRTAVAAAVAVGWTLFLYVNFVTIGGAQYYGSTTAGASDLALVPVRAHTSIGAYGFGLWHKSNLLRPFFAWPFGKANS